MIRTDLDTPISKLAAQVQQAGWEPRFFCPNYVTWTKADAELYVWLSSTARPVDAQLQRNDQLVSTATLTNKAGRALFTQWLSDVR